MKANYKIVECYQTYDGKIFTNGVEAKARADDILGEELEGLLGIAELDITRTQEFKAILAWMKDRERLTKIIDNLYAILHFEDEEE